MSEVLNLESRYGTEVPAPEPGTYAAEIASNQEIKDPTWGHTLHDLVSANASVVVECPWMAGAKVTLAEAMTTYAYPSSMTAEDEPFVLLVVHELLATQVQEIEEPQQQSETEENIQTGEDLPRVEAVREEGHQKYDSKEDRQASHASDSEMVESISDNEVASNEAAATSPSSPEDTVRLDYSEESEVPASAGGTSPITQPEPAIKPEDLGQRNKKVQKKTTINPHKNNLEEVSRPSEERGSEPSTAILTIETVIAPELVEPVILEQETGLLNEALATDERIVVDSAEPAPASDKSNIYESDEPDFRSTEESFGENFDLQARAESLAVFTDDEPVLIEQESLAVSTAEQLSVPLAEVEDFLAQLTECIDNNDPETAAVVNKNLDKIMEIAAALEANNSDTSIVEAEAQEEIEELYIEVLEALGMEYRPELIESLVRLTIYRQLVGEEMQEEEEVGEVPQDTGTHEAITQLIVSASNIKKTLEYTCAIGNSALKLSFNLATSLV